MGQRNSVANLGKTGHVASVLAYTNVYRRWLREELNLTVFNRSNIDTRRFPHRLAVSKTLSHFGIHSHVFAVAVYS
jgi:hypothetical protein